MYNGVQWNSIGCQRGPVYKIENKKQEIAYPTAYQNISLLTSLSFYFQKPLKIRKIGFEIRV